MRIPLILLGMLVASLLGSGLASAHKGESPPPDTATSVRQAIAFLDLSPPNLGEAREKTTWALAAKDQAGVDVDLLRKAGEALAAKEGSRARDLLKQSLAKAAPAQGPGPGVPGSATGEDEVAAHHVAGAPLDALEPRFSGTRGESLLLAAGIALVGLGFVTLRSSGARPPST